MANYLKKIPLGNLTAPQISQVVTFLQALGVSATDAQKCTELILQKINGNVTAVVITEVDAATDAAVLNDMAAGNVVSLLQR